MTPKEMVALFPYATQFIFGNYIAQRGPAGFWRVLENRDGRYVDTASSADELALDLDMAVRIARALEGVG